MESAIVCTNMKTTSEPPVDEVLVALSSMTVTETNSGGTKQKPRQWKCH